MGSSDSTPTQTHLVGPIHTPHTMTSTLPAHLVGKIATPVVGKIATPTVGPIATVGKIATPHVGKIVIVKKTHDKHTVGKIATPVVGAIHTPHTMEAGSMLSQGIPAYTNPNHISALSPVHNFHAIPQVNHEDHLTGYVMVPDKGTNTPANAVVMYQAGLDCSDPTHVAAVAPVANAVVGVRPVYNQCDQLIGHIGAVVKNAAAPVSVMLI